MTEGAAFSDGEYRRRQDAVLREAEAFGVDAVAVTYDIHTEYLTGTTGSQFWVAPVILVPGAASTFLVREFEADRVLLQARVDEVVTYEGRDDAVRRWAEELRRLGLDRSVLGLELDNFGLTHRDVAELRRLLPGLRICDVSHVLPRIMAIKSDEELSAMETCMRWTILAIETFGDALVEGTTERVVRDEMRRAVMDGGSEDLRGEVVFGDRTAIPHAAGTEHRLRAGDVAFTEASAYHLGYCAALCRTAIVGDHPDAISLFSVAEEALDAAIAALRPGATAGDVDAACRRVIEGRGLGASFRHRTGYANGLRANGRLNISLHPGATDVIEERMTFHLPIILFEPGRFSVGCSESVVVGSSGAEPIGTAAPRLIRRSAGRDR
jgi:Xaa-Pro aminopeptidase